jgi:hypothetical protein
MTGDRESRLAPEQDRSLENGPQRARPRRGRRIQRSRDRLRNPMIPGAPGPGRHWSTLLHIHKGSLLHIHKGS